MVATTNRAGGLAAIAALLGAAIADDKHYGFVHGDEAFFTVPATDHRIAVEDSGFVHAFWAHHGVWQHFTLESKEGAGKVRDGDLMYLKAWSGKYVQRQDGHFHAVSGETNEEEEFRMRVVRGEGDDDEDDDDEGEDGRSVARGGRGSGRLGGRGGGTRRGRPIAPGSRVVLETSSGEPVVVNDLAGPGVVKVGSEGADLDSRVLVAEMAQHLKTTAPPATTAASTTSPPTTTTLPPTTTTLPPTTTALPPTTILPATTSATLPPTTTTLPPTTTSLPPTTLPPTTTTVPPTTTASSTGSDLPSCARLEASGLAAALSVTTVKLPGPMRSSCPGFGIAFSCRHGFYAAHPGGMHALLYNDASENAVVVLLDPRNALVSSTAIGSEKVRGLQFEPSGAHLVALISGGTNVWLSPSYFVKMKVPSLEQVWKEPIESPLVGLERWTPDNADAIAVSNDRYVLHSAGHCRDRKWCAGHQGDITQVLDATTGERIAGEGKDWRASHAFNQIIMYNNASDIFLMANFCDYYPKDLVFNGFSKGRHSNAKAVFPGWGSGGGKQGGTQGSIAGDPQTGGFASVWSYGVEGRDPDKLYFATISKDVAFAQQPKRLFPNGGSELGGAVAPMGDGRWLVAYTEAPSDMLTDYLQIFFEEWWIPPSARTEGSRLAIVDSRGTVLGEPINIAALGAPFPVQIHHLVERADGLGWIFMDGPGKDTARIVQLKCQRAP